MFEQLRFLTFGWRDAIEIVVVAYGVYRLLLLLHGTRAVQMLIGIVVLVLTYALAWVFKFTMITYLLASCSRTAHSRRSSSFSRSCAPRSRISGSRV